MMQGHESHICVNGQRDQTHFSQTSGCQRQQGLINPDARQTLHRRSGTKGKAQRQHRGPDTQGSDPN